MTYQDALKARARMAYRVTGQIKTAAPKTQDEIVTEALMNQYFGGRKAMENANSAGKMYEVGKTLDAQNAASAEMAGEMMDWDAGYKAVQRVKDGTATTDDYQVAESFISNHGGNPTDNAEVHDVAKELRNRNWGIGAGLAGGAGIAAGAYGLAGLFPSLKKRRLLRALIALGAGAAGGAGIGIGVTKGLNSGKLQGAYGATKDALSSAYGKTKGALGDAKVYAGRVGRAIAGKGGASDAQIEAALNEYFADVDNA